MALGFPRGGDTGGRAPLAGQVSSPEGEILGGRQQNGLNSQQGASLLPPLCPAPPPLISENRSFSTVGMRF